MKLTKKKKQFFVAPIKESINMNLEYKNTEFKNCLLFSLKKNINGKTIFVVTIQFIK